MPDRHSTESSDNSLSRAQPTSDVPVPVSSTPVPSALPSRLARAIAVVSILVGGLCGGLIGYAFADIQCTGDCTTWKGIGILGGAALTALGVSIVAILTLRAMDEWDTIQARQTSGQPQ